MGSTQVADAPDTQRDGALQQAQLAQDDLSWSVPAASIALSCFDRIEKVEADDKRTVVSILRGSPWRGIASSGAVHAII